MASNGKSAGGSDGKLAGKSKDGKSKDDRDFLERPGHLIRRLQQISFALFVDRARDFDVTPVQYAALAAINNHPGIDQTALSNIIAFDRTTIGEVVRRLEKKKLIKRSNGAVDRRTKSLHITAAGERLMRDIEPAVAETQRLILAPLKPAARNAFMQMLKHLVHLNNAHSRAPQRLKETPERRFRAAARSAKTRRTARSAPRAQLAD
jgi:MarR family transcriptional regulator, lower aerobic nicotinate degradation pathway regulator